MEIVFVGYKLVVTGDHLIVSAIEEILEPVVEMHELELETYGATKFQVDCETEEIYGKVKNLLRNNVKKIP